MAKGEGRIPAGVAGHFNAVDVRDLADGVMREHGAEASGFRLLDGSYDSLAARLALIDSAVSSLDIQTYLWYPDHSGKLVLERAMQAADRGVQVRLIVDDLKRGGQPGYPLVGRLRGLAELRGVERALSMTGAYAR